MPYQEYHTCLFHLEIYFWCGNMSSSQIYREQRVICRKEKNKPTPPKNKQGYKRNIKRSPLMNKETMTSCLIVTCIKCLQSTNKLNNSLQFCNEQLMFIYIVYILFKHSSLIYITRTVVFPSPIPVMVYSLNLTFSVWMCSEMLNKTILEHKEISISHKWGHTRVHLLLITRRGCSRKPDWWVLERCRRLCDRDYSAINIHLRKNNKNAAERQEKIVTSMLLCHYSVNVHFRKFGLCCFLFHASRGGFVRVGRLVLRPLVPVDGSVLSLLILRKLHLGFGLGNHRIAGGIKLLSSRKASTH